MRIAIGSDHAGYELKQHLVKSLPAPDVEVRDVGPCTLDRGDDYPDFAYAVAEAVLSGECDLGIMICSTGVGACIAANKVRGIRAALSHDLFTARRSREHNDANVLCLGSKLVGPNLAEAIAREWIAQPFDGAERHRRRLAKVARLESSGAPD